MKFNVNKSIKKTIFCTIIASTLFSTTAFAQADTIISNQAQSLSQSTQKQIPATNEIKDFNPMVFMDGKQVTFKNAIKNYKDSTYLPFREVGDLIGANAQWNAEYKVAKFTKDSTTVEIVSQTDKSVVSKNGNIEEVTITNGKTSIPALNINGATYVPLRYLSESFGMDIKYHNPHAQTGTKTITINQHDNLDYKKPVQQGVHPINQGKVAKAPDGVDYNAKYLDYFEGRNHKPKKRVDGKVLNDFNPYVAGDFNLLFSQVSSKTGAKAIPNLWIYGPAALAPVYDYDGDGLLNGKPYSSYDMFKPGGWQEVELAQDAEMDKMGIWDIEGKPHNYTLPLYAGGAIDYSSEPDWSQGGDGGEYYRAHTKLVMDNLSDGY